LQECGDAQRCPKSTTHTIGGKGAAKAPMASEMPAMAKARASCFLENLISALVGCLLPCQAD